MVQNPDRLINREDPKVREFIQETIEEEGIDVRMRRNVEKARKEGEASVVTLDGSKEVATDVVGNRTHTPVDTLLDSVFQFPTFSQGNLEALEQLEL